MVRQERNLSEGESAGGGAEDDEEDDFYPTQAGKSAKKKLRADRWRQQDRLLARAIRKIGRTLPKREMDGQFFPSFIIHHHRIHPTTTKNQERI